MRLLILTQYYPPETGAPQNRLSDLARRLARRGHAVTALTAMPNYPKGRIFDGYRGRLVFREILDGVRVLRTWIYATPGKGFAVRLLNYFSFVATSLLFGSGRIGRQDVVLVESPPLFLGITGWILARLSGARLVFNVSDLWPASAVALGMVRNRALIGAAERLELFFYRAARLVTGQTRGIVDDIRRRCPGSPVLLYTNGVDTAAFGPEAGRARAEIRRRHGLAEDAFVAGYAGLHGLAQGLDILLDAAKRAPQVVFALWGDGPVKADLQARAAGLANVRFFPTLPSRDVPGLLSSFDAAVVPLKKDPLFQGALPSKMFEAMAAARPLLLAVDGEARALVERAGAGLCVPPEDGGALAEAVERLRGDPALAAQLGAQGRAHVLEHYDRERIAERLERALEEVRR